MKTMTDPLERFSRSLSLFEPIHVLASMLIFLSIMTMGCQKESPFMDPPVEEQKDIIENLVWQHRFDTISDLRFSIAQPVLYHGNPVYLLSTEKHCQLGSANMVVCLDACTGQKLWGFNYGDTCQITDARNAYIYRDILVVNTNRAVWAFDLLTREAVWQLPIECPMAGSYGFTGFGDKVYLAISFGDGPYHEAYGILEIDVHTGQDRKIIESLTKEENAHLAFNPPSLWESTSGDSSLLLFSAPKYTGHPSYESFALFAYDRQKGMVAWVADSIGYPTNNYSHPTVYENKVILAVGNGVQCFNVHDGRRLWKTTLPGCEKYQSCFAGVQPVAVKDRIILSSSSDPLYCLDVHTGKILWSQDKISMRGSNAIIVHEDVIYHPGGKDLYGIDLFTGQVLMHARGPRNSVTFQSDQLLLNEERKLLFAYDHYDVLAYRTLR